MSTYLGYTKYKHISELVTKFQMKNVFSVIIELAFLLELVTQLRYKDERVVWYDFSTRVLLWKMNHHLKVYL